MVSDVGTLEYLNAPGTCHVDSKSLAGPRHLRLGVQHRDRRHRVCLTLWNEARLERLVHQYDLTHA